MFPRLRIVHSKLFSAHFRNEPQVRNISRFVSKTYDKRLPVNTIINIVPQQEAWVIERLGKYHKVLEPGLSILIPFIDRIAYAHSLKELALDIPSQSAITRDNVTLHLDGVLYLKVFDPHKASYGVENAEYAVTQLAQTTMRSEIGKLSLDSVFHERSLLNSTIVEVINQAAYVWGISCLRYEIRDIDIPKTVVEAMQMQVAADRKKRAAVLMAEGEKTSQILKSEAVKQESVNKAEGEAAAVLAKAKATAASIDLIAASINREGGSSAVSLNIAEQYVKAFSNIAKESTTMLLPSTVSDLASMTASALSIFKKISAKEGGQK